MARLHERPDVCHPERYILNTHRCALSTMHLHWPAMLRIAFERHRPDARCTLVLMRVAHLSYCASQRRIWMQREWCLAACESGDQACTFQSDSSSSGSSSSLPLSTSASAAPSSRCRRAKRFCQTEDAPSPALPRWRQSSYLPALLAALAAFPCSQLVTVVKSVCKAASFIFAYLASFFASW